jgi:hypothetical protein
MIFNGTLEIKTEWYIYLEKEMWKGCILKEKIMENQLPMRLCRFAYRIISKALNLIPTDMSVEPEVQTGW